MRTPTLPGSFWSRNPSITLRPPPFEKPVSAGFFVPAVCPVAVSPLMHLGEYSLAVQGAIGILGEYSPASRL